MTGIKLTFIFLSGLILGYVIHAWQSANSSPDLAETRAVVVDDSTPMQPAPRRLLKRDRVSSVTVESVSLVDSLTEIVNSEKPALRDIKLTELGLRAAQEDLDAAMHAMGALQDRRAKKAYMRGVFSHIAETKTPYQAIARARSLDRELENSAMGVLVSEWTKRDVHDNSITGLSAALLLDETVSQDAKASWLKAFENHALSGEMLGMMASMTAADDVDAALAMGDQLAGWQRERFVDRFAKLWARRDPAAALEWAQRNPEQLAPAAMSELITLQYGQSPAEAIEAFNALHDPEQRRLIAADLAGVKARGEGTEAAVLWADSLSNAAEQDAAHERIYRDTPRGIGALLTDNNDMTVVMDTFPGTPAHAAGLRKGDRIVEVDSGDGNLVPTNALQGTIDLIRGEPGTPVRLRILRSGGGGTLEEHVIEMNRQQLVLPGR